jgi:DNA-binding MarR family transcriptional regulator
MSGTLTEVKMSSTPKPRFPEQRDFIGRLIRDAFTRLMEGVQADVADEQPQSTPAQSQVLALIDAAGTRPAELARRAGVTRQSMAETLALLAANGLVDLRPDPGDGRAKLVVVTDAGWMSMRRGLAAALAVHRHWEELLGEAKMARLMKLLRELLDKLEAEAAADA